MAITEAFANSATISTTEYFLASNSTTATYQTTDGVFQCFLDLNALTATEEYEFKVYEKVQSAGTSRLVAQWTISGAQAEPHYVSPSMIFMHGWEFSLKKLAGTDRAIAWSIRQVA